MVGGVVAELGKNRKEYLADNLQTLKADLNHLLGQRLSGALVILNPGEILNGIEQKIQVNWIYKDGYLEDIWQLPLMHTHDTEVALPV